MPASATNAERISRPSSVRIGIACRFGFDVESRPVAATAWLIVVCRRAVLADQRRQRPRYVLISFDSSRHSSITGDDLVLAADRAQDARVGRVARLALPARGKAELLEQDPRDLLGRAEHELLARELVRLRLELLDAVGEAGRDLAHPVRVDPDAGVLHLREHRRRAAARSSRTAPVPALEQAGAHLRDQPERQRRAPDEGGRLLVGLGRPAGRRRRTRSRGRRARRTARPGSIR